MIKILITLKAALWQRGLDVGLSPRYPRFNTRLIQVEYVLIKIAMGAEFLEYVWFFLCIIPQMSIFFKTSITDAL